MASLVYHNEAFHPKCPTTTPSKKRVLLEGGSSIPIDECIYCLFTLDDVVQYARDYYKVINPSASGPYTPTIKKINGRDTVHYHIRLICDYNTIDGNSENNKTVCVPQAELSKLMKADRSEISALASHVNRYNGTILKLSKTPIRGENRPWHNIEYPLQMLSLPYVLDTKKGIGNLRDSKISELASVIKRKRDPTLQFRYICQTPFSFIREDWELFTFDRAYDIATTYQLITADDIKEKAWLYSYVHAMNTFYIDKNLMSANWRENKFKIYNQPPRSMLDSGIIKTQKIEDKEYFTTQYLIDFERRLGEKIKNLFSKSFSPYSISDIEMHIREFEMEPNRFILNEKQREAVITSLTSNACIITGCPGTGKSTIIECVLYILSKKDAFKNISICAPTGLAYKNLIDKVGNIQVGDKILRLDDSASGTVNKVLFNDCPRVRRTEIKESEISDIHTFIGADRQKAKYRSMENIDLFILDECSMIDTWLFDRLMNECEVFNSRLILVGDVNQLPSVGPGKVLKSMIDSGLFRSKTVVLNQICRQDSGALLNGILKMAAGGVIDSADFADDTLYFDPISSIKTGNRLDESKVYNLLDANSLTSENSKIICYNSSQKHPVNTINLNMILQKKYNPDGAIIQNPWGNKGTFRVGDRIMLTSNEVQNDMKGIEYYRVNGDEAKILRVVDDGIVIEYVGSTKHCISINTLYQSYQLSYALSVHKSQGSQYENIVFMLDNIYNIDKRVVFTAISRATQKCMVLSNMSSFVAAQQRVYDKPSMLLTE